MTENAAPDALIQSRRLRWQLNCGKRSGVLPALKSLSGIHY